MTKKKGCIECKYNLKKQVFFNWYFTHQSKEKVAAFISPYFLDLVNKDVHFSLKDLLNSVGSVPSHLLDTNLSTKINVMIEANKIILID